MVHVVDEYMIVLVGFQDRSRGTINTEEDFEEVFFVNIISSVVDITGIVDILAI